jgi:hypothetical protein
MEFKTNHLRAGPGRSGPLWVGGAEKRGAFGPNKMRPFALRGGVNISATERTQTPFSGADPSFLPLLS